MRISRSEAKSSGAEGFIEKLNTVCNEMNRRKAEVRWQGCEHDASIKGNVEGCDGTDG